jgi:type III pantothenate kinase
MLLAIDVGNTNIVLGVFDGEKLAHSWRLTTLRERTADEVGILLTQLFEHRRLEPSRIDAIVMGSVVPSLTPIMMTMGQRYFGSTPLNVEPGIRTGMPILYENPTEVGADRIVNGVAAYEEYGRSQTRAVIVVDFGTATTFDAISAKGEYLGGVICPGIHISAEALAARAARLPKIEVQKPPRVIGRTTADSMRSGLFYGYIGMIEGLVTRMRRELGEPVVCVATGGLAEAMAPETHLIEDVSPDLTLQGLRIVWERNQ